ncbi:ATP-binding protein, partial [Acaryochloris sp. IP29b_bin.137]|uniref:ATP-binding protein n=1 Tax=Acaryochloris sp. IP29b_bin.137 TaxID=2969217 RepID=UPI002633A13A
QVLGVEPIDGSGRGKLDQLRYPPQPASSAYRPNSEDIARVVVGELQDKQNRALDLATLANRTEVDVKVDGHAIVSRHLAILAMTGAGKSVTSRRIIEELSNKNYPIIIFDPHGDYTGLKEVSQLESRVKLYYADLPIWDGSFDDAIKIINGLSGEELSIPQEEAFESVFSSRKTILSQSNISSGKIKNFLYNVIQDSRIQTYPIQRDLFALAYICDAVGILGKKVSDKEERDASASFIDEFSDLGFEAIRKVDGRSAGTFKALARKLRRSAFALREMENINRSRAGNAEPLPIERLSLINYGQISVISLAGYTELLQATLYTLIAKDLFRARVQGSLPYQYFMVLEEAHNFVPSKSDNPAIVRSIGVTKQIAQEGRKFGVGLLLISQRPSRLDETTLAMCNSYIIMRMVNPADQNFVRKVVESLGEDEAKMLPDLDVGEAILSGQLINFPVLVRIKKPQSSGEREERDAFEVLEEANRAAKPNRSRR